MTSGTGDKVKGRIEKAAGELLDDDRFGIAGPSTRPRARSKTASSAAWTP